MLRNAAIALVAAAGLAAGGAPSAADPSDCIRVRTGGSDRVISMPGTGRSDVVVRGRVSSARRVRVWFEYGISARDGLRRTRSRMVDGGHDRRVSARIRGYRNFDPLRYRIVARRDGNTVAGALRDSPPFEPKGNPPVPSLP